MGLKLDLEGVKAWKLEKQCDKEGTFFWTQFFFLRPTPLGFRQVVQTRSIATSELTNYCNDVGIELHSWTGEDRYIVQWAGTNPKPHKKTGNTKTKQPGKQKKQQTKKHLF